MSAADKPLDDKPTLGEFETVTYALTGIVSAIHRVNEDDDSRIDRREVRNEIACLVAAGEYILKGVRDRF